MSLPLLLSSSPSSMASLRIPTPLAPTPSFQLQKKSFMAAPPLLPPPPPPPSSKSRKSRIAASFNVCAFFNPIEDQPILKDAAKEPVAFLGGVFAGLLRLNLNEDPLKEWIARTVEASGISPDEVASAEGMGEGGGGRDGGLAQEIEIE
ncbi:UPF0426 protein, chloroplastic [Iris pallida]|uniref:UPF0426 protein, chloroplastic n=1 Tax=Iris pallida TaxID=29817 RepID=A0AAX6GNS6_IRIPA|nr:UPF0426 protein, chloroplastic [Iris pallida]